MERCGERRGAYPSPAAPRQAALAARVAAEQKPEAGGAEAGAERQLASGGAGAGSEWAARSWGRCGAGRGCPGKAAGPVRPARAGQPVRVWTQRVPTPAACGERGRPQPVSVLGAAGAWAGRRCAGLRRCCSTAAPGRPLSPNAQKLSPAAHHFVKSAAPGAAHSPLTPVEVTRGRRICSGMRRMGDEFVAAGIKALGCG